MICPRCKNKLSFSLIHKREFRCLSCDADLLIENNFIILNFVLFVCGIIVTIGISEGSFEGIMLSSIISIGVYFFITPRLLKVVTK